MKIFFAIFISLILSGCGANSTSVASPKKQSSNQEKTVQIENMFADYQKSFKDVPFLDPREDVITSNNPLFVDVREPREQQVSMIQNAITKEEFEKDQDKYKNRKVIVYCTIGFRSAFHTRVLRSKGFEAYNMKGGILLWAHAGKPVSDKNGATKRVHVYGSKWDLLPEGWQSVMGSAKD